MKKTVTIFLSFAVLIVAVSMFTLSAFAETTTKYWQSRPGAQDTEGYVNGESFDEIYSQADPQSEGIKITYGGKGKLTGWEFPLLEEGKDYEIVSQKGNSITIKLCTENRELPYINALVDFGETKTPQQKPTTDSTTNSKTNKYITGKMTETTAPTDTQEINGSSTADKQEISNGSSAEEKTTEITAKTNNNELLVCSCIAICVTVCITVGIGLKKKKS